MDTVLSLEPWSRKAVMVLSEHDLERCEYDSDGAEALTNAEVAILPFPIATAPDMPLALQNILGRGVGRPGEFLIQSPFDPDEYAPAASASEQFALEKHMVASRLCKLLGAKTFSVEQIDLRTASGSASVAVKGGKGPARVDATVEQQKVEAFKRQLKSELVLTGGAANIAAAERLLREKRLWGDPTLRALVEMRRDDDNPVVSHKLVLSLSSETESNLRLAANAKVPSFVNLSADVTRAFESRCEYTVTTEVTF